MVQICTNLPRTYRRHWLRVSQVILPVIAHSAGISSIIISSLLSAVICILNATVHVHMSNIYDERTMHVLANET